MAEETVRPIDPLPEEFEGSSAGRILKRLIHAARPSFFPASVLPVLAGTAWGVSVSGAFDAYVFVIAVLATVCVHAMSNVLNDVGDEDLGTDRMNVDRIYPYTGGSRFIQMGILSQGEMRRWGVGLLIAAVLLGALLLVEKGPAILIFGLIGIALGVLYSLGPLKLCTAGLGEIAVALAFGVLPVSGAAWLQGAPIDMTLVLYSLPVSLWVCAILLINEVPDTTADAASGKGTLPVHLGLAGTSRLYFLLQLVAALVTVYLAYTGAVPLLAPLVPIGLLAIAVRATAAIRVGVADRRGMTRAIESTLGIHTIGSAWLAICMVYRVVF